MTKDPIVDELDRLRAEQMEKYQFDFEAYYRDLKEQEKSLEQPLLVPPDFPSAKPPRTGGIRR